MMTRQTRVSVFESEIPAEIQLIKSKLEDAGIQNFTQNNFMTFIATPTANTLRLQVNLVDEKDALKIIDDFLQESELNLESK